MNPEAAYDGATFEKHPPHKRTELIKLHNYLLTFGKPDDVPVDIWLVAAAAAPDIRMSVDSTEFVSDILGMMDVSIAETISRLLMAERSALIPVEPVPTPREAELEAALRPFAATAEVDIGSTETDEDIFQQAHHNRAPKITVGDFRRARLALNPTHGKEPKDVA